LAVEVLSVSRFAEMRDEEIEAVVEPIVQYFT